MRTACKPSRHNFEKYIRRKCVYCLEQSKQRKHAGCATVKGGHIQKELVSALITSTPVDVLLQAKHYHQGKLWTLCTSVNNWSHRSPGILKHRSQKSLIWKASVEVMSGASLLSHHLLRAGTASAVQRFSSGSHSVKSDYPQGRWYSLSGQPAALLHPQLWRFFHFI